jgi:AcrR family transcriptional regulator
MDSGVTDPRMMRTRERALNAALDLLAEHGYADFSVEAVVLRSGVAKTTLYRHWPNRIALLRDAVAALEGETDLPDTGALRTDLVAFFAPRIRVSDTRRWERCMPALVEAAAFHPELAEVVATLTRGVLDGIKTLLERANRRGELAGHPPDLDALASILIGPIVFRRLLLQEAPTQFVVQAHIDFVLAPYSAPLAVPNDSLRS